MLSAYILINVVYSGFILSLILLLVRLKDESNPPIQETDQALSLLIPIRNEKSNALELCETLWSLKQNFKNLEIILVNDNSDDGTEKIIQTWLKNRDDKNKIKLINVLDGNASKKKAISIALNQASYDWIIQTDADCQFDSLWLESIKKIDKTEKNFIAGPVLFKSNGFWSEFLKLESVALILISYLGFKLEKPQMCSAANMCWKKSILMDQDYSQIVNSKVLSGDDAFLLNYFNSVNPKALFYNWNKNAIVWTKAPKNLHSFINQRLRWASKWGAIKGFSQIVFPLLLWLYHLIHFALALFLLINGFYFTTLFIVFIKASLEFFMLQKVANNFEESISVLHVILMQLLYSPYVVIFGLLSQFADYRWK